MNWSARPGGVRFVLLTRGKAKQGASYVK